MEMMKWNGMRVLKWKWKIVSEIEVTERNNEMGIEGKEWIENIYANENEKKTCVVMRVMEVK